MEPNSMRDPATANSRIYVGNIQEGVSSPDLTAHFSKYGIIRGVLINRGFGFIQFDNEMSANKAIQGENNGMFQGRKIIVRNAVKNTASTAGGGASNSNASAGAAPVQPMPLEKELGLVMGQDLNRTARPQPAWNNNNWNNRGGKMNKNNMNNNPNNNSMDNERDRSPLGGIGGAIDQDQRWGNQNQNNFNSFGGGGGDNVGAGGNNNRFQQQQQQQQPQNMQYPPARSFNADRTDCEIIVVNKMLTQYAEAIESSLKRMGMIVDLLFPNEDVPMGKVLANIASRGCLYAILILPQNQEHRSMTVNVLHGQPIEHRNMPVEDALNMIREDFHERMHSDRLTGGGGGGGGGPLMPTAVEITPTSSYAAPPLNTRHPDAIQTLVNLLADNRPITVLQYDRVIRYLQERRELQLKAEIGDAPSDMPIPKPVDPEAELQKKILDILNKPSITAVPSPAKGITIEPLLKVRTAPPAVPFNSAGGGSGGAAMTSANSSSNQPQLLNDPKVQRALDSLLAGSLFKY